jgi:TolB-like protein/class 3 adenylate cyclase/Tfp pilus assembly protein PilF
MASTRRLAAILAADVVGYSRLMGEDEEGTHARLKAHFRELVDPKIAEHRGRIVKNTGDGLLAEFPSVVNAVRCAVEVQRGMIDREPDVPEECRIRFRIGVNLGDVIVEEHDIFGDGVNVAARLEALAEPGGICISGTVHDHIGDRLPYTFEDLGERSVKNIARPVRVYAWRPEGVAGPPTTSLPIAAPTRYLRGILAPIGAALVSVLVIAVVTWWFWPTTRPSPTPTPAVAATSIAQPLVAPPLSIVVLPFANLSNDPDQQYFADGITENLTTALSRFADMFVISRNSAFTYRNKPADTKQIGRELGVRYVLEGSVQRSGSKVRVNAQLIDAATDAHLWAEQFDGDTADLLALQDDITRRIAITLNLEITAAEAVRPTQNPGAMDYVLRGRAALNRSPSRENYAEALNSFEHALELDSQSTDAQLGLANVLVNRVLDFGGSTATDDIKQAETLAKGALAAAPRNALAHAVKAAVLRAQRRCAEAIPEYETALALNHNAVGALANIGRCKIYIGPIAEAIPIIEQAIRLSPRDPYIGNQYFRIGEAHLLQSHIDDAILWFEKAGRALPEQSFFRGYLTSAYALKGDSEHAAAELAEARKLGGEGSWQSIARLRANTRYEAPTIRALAEATFYAGLRTAGVPEQ